MNNPAVIFDPNASVDLRKIVQTMVSNYNVAVTGRGDWYPIAFFLKDGNGEVLGGLHRASMFGWLDGRRWEDVHFGIGNETHSARISRNLIASLFSCKHTGNGTAVIAE